MALRRRSSGSHHRPDWEQRLCRVDAALADDDLALAPAPERSPALGRELADGLQGDQRASDAGHADDARLDIDDPPPVP